MLLEEKTALGLAAAPIEDTPWELLTEEQLETRALAAALAKLMVARESGSAGEAGVA